MLYSGGTLRTRCFRSFSTSSFQAVLSLNNVSVTAYWCMCMRQFRGSIDEPSCASKAWLLFLIRLQAH
ncbi:unnamed protein product [Chondrus crispus]|uniref:Uncharacterized protein n=1 Tax=Chondrus crispus TaxID=2769 RepID=R7QNV0_CHOCR|nr:unnamed protein product [Chondrus crispus]CDF39779.1 unnamed protein product [Chondrus crispus]|eukprot:XP_005710073.1 unnamed protein product [Chondrus crispus]